MDLSPYLKLLLDKKADCLVLKAESAPSLRLLNQEKAIGNTAISTDFLEKFIDSLLDETQKQDLSNYKTIRLSYSPSVAVFIVQIDKSVDGLSVLISPDKRSREPTENQLNIQVLGEMPESNLYMLPYLT